MNYSELAGLTAEDMQRVLTASDSKAHLVEAWYALTGKRGDVARTDKTEYASKLAQWPVRARAIQALVDTVDGAAPDYGREAQPQQAPASAATPAHSGSEAAEQLAALIRSMAGDSVNPAQVRAMVTEATTAMQRDVSARVDAALADLRKVAESVTPREIHVSTDKAPAVKVADHTHPLFEKALRLVATDQINLLLVGPAGCGKSHLAEQLAKALGREFGTLHCTAGASESQLTGWLLPADGGVFKFKPAQFATLYKRGNSVFLLDELDAADPNMLLVVNGALANGHLHIPQDTECPVWKRGEKTAIIAAANTYGTGADMAYAGRNPLDGATLDRFYVLEMGYDTALEAKLSGRAFKPAAPWKERATTPQEIQEFGEWCDMLRAKVAELKLRRIVSTRTHQKGIAALQARVPLAEVKRDLLAGWTRDELQKTGAL